ncbi:MAG: MarR family winged helix-turn-helix transcriptional regulator [Alphaproteobacteria bacterium]|nr:MarR family winged helix-turn-helix transcriptional regulator [Alphaproteobacteria bacterium]
MTKTTATPLRYSETDPLAFKVLNEIGIIAQLARVELERATGDALSGAGFSVLNHLARLPGVWAPARLARAFQVTKGAMTNTLQRLEAEGYVKIVDDPKDGRAKHVTITRKGLKARDAALTGLTPLLKELTKTVGAETFRDLLPGLARLRSVLDAARDA